MSMLDIHAAALSSANGPFHEFLLSYKTTGPIVYGFVEGRDDPSFYRGFIEQALPDGWSIRLIRSGNRDAVLSLLAGMPWDRFSKNRVCFFIDRDLSDFLDANPVVAENLYVTDNYSIENDVVNSHVLERVLEEVLGVTSLSDLERSRMISLFESNLAAFCDAMAAVMAQVIVWRRAQANASLDNIKTNNFYEFIDARIALRESFTSREQRIAYAAKAVGLSEGAEQVLKAAEEEFRSRDGTGKFVRGKYILSFFVHFLEALHSAIPQYCARHKAPPKARLTIGAASAMTIVGPRARPAQSLRDFLARNFGAYVATQITQ